MVEFRSDRFHKIKANGSGSNRAGQAAGTASGNGHTTFTAIDKADRLKVVIGNLRTWSVRWQLDGKDLRLTYNRADATPTQIAARLSLTFAIASIVVLLLLHVARSDLDPMSSVLSEYALGESGWLGVTWFLVLAVACASLSYALAQTARSYMEIAGIALLSLGAVGLILGGIFPMDSPAAPQPTISGVLHGIAGMIGITSLVLASLVLGWKLAKRAPWAPVRGPLIFLSVSTLLADVGMTAAAVASGAGQPGSGGDPTMIGLGNRLLMISFTIWLMVAAWALCRRTEAYAANQ